MNQEIILKTVVDVLNKHNIKYILGWGTLLGVVRDNDFLEWEPEDIDLAVFKPFWNEYPLYENFVKDIYDAGLEIKDASYNYLCIWDGKIHLDLHWMEKDSENYLSVKVTGEKQIFAKDSILPIQIHKGYYYPALPSSVLRQLYGEDWRSPKPYDHTHLNTQKINNHKKIIYPFIVSLKE